MNSKLLMFLASKAADLIGHDPAPMIDRIDADTISIGVECVCGRVHYRLFYIPDGGECFRKTCLDICFQHRNCPCNENIEYDEFTN